MSQLVTKVELLREAQHLRNWTYNRYGDFDADKVDEVDYALSSHATNCIQKWIDASSAWCNFNFPENDKFFKVSFFVAEKMKAIVPQKRVVFMCPEQKQTRMFVNLNDRCEVSKDIGALALVYSVILQMVEALPNEPYLGFNRSILNHLMGIDGTRKTFDKALGVIVHLLEALRDGLLIIIDNIDRLYLEEVSSSILSALLGAIGESKYQTRVWISYRRPGNCDYRSHTQRESFKLKPGFSKLVGHGYSLKDLRFGGSTIGYNC
jgi:hypothetical protein